MSEDYKSDIVSDASLRDQVLFLGEEHNNGDFENALSQDEQIRVLTDRVNKLEKINCALISQVERTMDQHKSSYSMFRSAHNLEEKVKARTEELRTTLDKLEKSNIDLAKAKERAEHLNKSKTKFLAAASHDLLQPLSAARLNMSALKDENKTSQGEKLIGKIDQSLLTIEELLRTLFDISKLDAGVSMPDICRFSSDRILRGLKDNFDALAKQKGLKFHVRSSNIIVETDPIFLRRILQNLVSNALRYTKTGGVLVGARKRGTALVFQVWDTGMGIPENEHDRIFDEFHRGQLDEHQDGLGLGLAIVQRMAKAVGHTVEFVSVPKRGSMFSVLVPMSSSQSHLVDHIPQSPIGVSSLLRMEDAFVALIEDDLSVRDAMQRLLHKWGARCIIADSWAEIQNQLKDVERLPDLIIADYHLTDEIVGPEVVGRIRGMFADEGGQKIPGLIVSATPSSEIRRMAEKMSCEFMTKPVEPAELRALIIHLFNS